MCRKHRMYDSELPAEGRTVQLAAEGGPVAERRCGWGAFPWWTLWLIWPAVGLVKWTAPLVAALYAELMSVSLPLLPLLLIVVGLALLVRRRLD